MAAGLAANCSCWRPGAWIPAWPQRRMKWAYLLPSGRNPALLLLLEPLYGPIPHGAADRRFRPFRDELLQDRLVLLAHRLHRQAHRAHLVEGFFAPGHALRRRTRISVIVRGVIVQETHCDLRALRQQYRRLVRVAVLPVE